MQDGTSQIGRTTDFLGPIVDAERLANEIAEPLLESAPVAFATAMARCTLANAQRDCRAYHAVWQYLRLTDVIRAVRIDGPLFVAAVKAQAARVPLRRILVSGSADYSMLAYLAHAAGSVGASPAFDVVDRCETTLLMNEWYGARRGLAVRAIHTDVNAFEPKESYDLIATHSFLHWPDAAQRTRLFRNWRSWLAPEGRLCFSNRIETVSHGAHGADATGPADRTGEMVSDFFRRRTEMRLNLPVPDPEFESLIRSYAAPMLRVHDLTMQRLQGHFDDAGLLVECALRVTEAVPGHGDVNSAPVPSEGRPRFWFQARRA